jgi:hypothetical protein
MRFRQIEGNFLVVTESQSEQDNMEALLKRLLIPPPVTPPVVEPPPVVIPPVVPPVPPILTLDAHDVLHLAQPDVPFAQHSGFTAQVMNSYTAAEKIPEGGINGPSTNGQTLRLGKIDAYGDKKAFLFRLAPGDPKTSGSWRSEFSFGQDVEMEKTYWIAFRMFVYDWGGDAGSGLFGFQVHSGSKLDLSPSAGLYYVGRNMQIETRYSTADTPSQSNTVSKKHTQIPIPFGSWMDWVICVRESTSGKGFVRAWLNEALVANHAGNLGYKTGVNSYFKSGIYNWSGFKTPRTVLMRNIIIVRESAVPYGPDIFTKAINQ